MLTVRPPCTVPSCEAEGVYTCDVCGALLCPTHVIRQSTGRRGSLYVYNYRCEQHRGTKLTRRFIRDGEAES